MTPLSWIGHCLVPTIMYCRQACTYTLCPLLAAADTLMSLLSMLCRQHNKVWAVSSTLICCCVLCSQVEWFHSVITRQDKAGMIMFGILGTAASYSLMMLLPPGWVDLPVAAAVKEASDRLTSLVDKRFGDVGKQSFATSSDPVLLAVPLSVIGGFISKLTVMCSAVVLPGNIMTPGVL